MKRKFSMALALVLALMLLGGTALATGLGLNLFELSGNRLLQNIADRAVLETQEPVTVQDEQLGEVEAVIANAYYDGQSLAIAYQLTNWKRMELWTPTEEQKANLEPYDDANWIMHLMHVGGVEPPTDGAPYGVMQYEVSASDHMTANGIDVPPQEAGGGEDEHSRCETIEYAAPLPEGVADQDSLELRIPLNQNILYYWFDGKQWYVGYEHQKGVSAMTATVRRDAKAQIGHWTGSGEVNGVPVTVSVDASIIRADVTVTAAEDVFLPIEAEDGYWLNPWEIALTDELGRSLDPKGASDVESARELHISCRGTGFIPENLSLLIYRHDWMRAPENFDKDKAAGVMITLTAE